MKKIVLTLALAGMMGTAFGQGVVNFANNAATDVYTNATQTIWGTVLSGNTSGLTATVANGGSFFYALLMQPYSSGPTASTSLSSLAANGWLATGLIGAPALGAGRIAGGAPATTLSADPVGSGNQFTVLGWSGNVAPGTLAGLATVEANLALGSTYNWTLSSGVNGFIGISAVGTGTGQGASSPELLYGTGGIAGFENLYEVPVPEPATFALVGLGGLAMLMFRRRN
jgi:xanthosine utilization system XapX-like protein